MAVLLTIDVSDVQGIGRVLQHIQPGLDAALPLEVNEAGLQLFDDVVRLTAERFPDVPPQAIAAALYSTQASHLLPSYTIGARDAELAYVRWVTQRDEKVCKICGPREGRTYPISAVGMIWPAHPNCRCTLERLDLSEAMLAAGYEALPDAMGAVAGGILEHFERLFTQFGGR